ncbi:MAG: ATP-grasp domain-containing protein [Solobacterium sp.]|nr:ATP-grasp domain-containing protein [Solobacterium sp.]
MKKLAVIGASYLQAPLIVKAKEMGLETHVFAWAAGDIGETLADHFYPISIIEKDEILEKCRQIGIDGVCSISSDLAAVTVNYIAEKMHLTGNSMACTTMSTNKHAMRMCFEEHGDPSVRSIIAESAQQVTDAGLSYPLIIKPTDRSGSRAITKLSSSEGLEEAIAHAKRESFEHRALAEEFAEGKEYSVECLSCRGRHYFLTVTKKYTTGAPGFVETAHLEPSDLDEAMTEKVRKVIFHALDSLCIENGASHSEIRIDGAGRIRIIEIGGRMGGDCIGSHLVRLSCGNDFVRDVIRISLGEEVVPSFEGKRQSACIRFVFSREDLAVLDRAEKDPAVRIEDRMLNEITDEAVHDSASRFGYFILTADRTESLLPYLPEERI